MKVIDIDAIEAAKSQDIYSFFGGYGTFKSPLFEGTHDGPEPKVGMEGYDSEYVVFYHNTKAAYLLESEEEIKEASENGELKSWILIKPAFLERFYLENS